MKKNEYAIHIYDNEGLDNMVEALNGVGVAIPAEINVGSKKKRIVWRELYIVDMESKTVQEITDYDEYRAFFHTGECMSGVEAFKRAVSSGSKPARIWKQIYRQDGTLGYEGFTENGRPHGAGKSFYPDGSTFQEGIFGEKGLLSGVEYYDNGQVRFDGILKFRYGYGPNYPVYGRCYYRDGRLMYDGEFKITFGGSMGYPHVAIPEDYGSLEPNKSLRF